MYIDTGQKGYYTGPSNSKLVAPANKGKSSLVKTVIKRLMFLITLIILRIAKKYEDLFKHNFRWCWNPGINDGSHETVSWAEAKEQAQKGTKNIRQRYHKNASSALMGNLIPPAKCEAKQTEAVHGQVRKEMSFEWIETQSQTSSAELEPLLQDTTEVLVAPRYC